MPAMPLAFEPNQGQADPAVRFLSQRGGRSTFLTGEGATFVVGTEEPSAVTMRLVDANSEIDIEPLEPLPTRKHYYIGNDPDKWVTNVPTFERVRYHQVYPGIDLDFYSNDGRLEYDFIVAPEADPSVILIAFEGADETRLTNGGALSFRAASGEVRHHKPFVYQEKAGERTEVQGAFRREADGGFRFELADYNPLLALVIDPEVTFATYAGGDLFDFAVDGAYEPNGNLWVIGNTFSPNFPGPQKGVAFPGGGPGGVPAGGNAFLNQYVLESSEPGNDTYSLANVMIIGGSGDDSVGGIALATDSIFNTGKGAETKGVETEPGMIVFVGGTTDSADFPMLGALAGGTDMWVAQIGPVGQVAFSSDGKGPPVIPPLGIINAVPFGTLFNDPFGGFPAPPHYRTPGFPCPLPLPFPSGGGRLSPWVPPSPGTPLPSLEPGLGLRPQWHPQHHRPRRHGPRRAESSQQHHHARSGDAEVDRAVGSAADRR